MVDWTNDYLYGCMSSMISKSECCFAAHSLRNDREGGDGRHEDDQVVELRTISTNDAGEITRLEHTAFLEYELSSASVRASTNSRRRLGKLA